MKCRQVGKWEIGGSEMIMQLAAYKNYIKEVLFFLCFFFVCFFPEENTRKLMGIESHQSSPSGLLSGISP